MVCFGCCERNRLLIPFSIQTNLLTRLCTSVGYYYCDNEHKFLMLVLNLFNWRQTLSYS